MLEPQIREIQPGKVLLAEYRVTRDAYDRASEHGYPAREARAMHDAEEALSVAREQYPHAALYARAESYERSGNVGKSLAGRNAMRAIEQGADPVATIAAMESEWTNYVTSHVD